MTDFGYKIANKYLTRYIAKGGHSILIIGTYSDALNGRIVVQGERNHLVPQVTLGSDRTQNHADRVLLLIETKLLILNVHRKIKNVYKLNKMNNINAGVLCRSTSNT